MNWFVNNTATIVILENPAEEIKSNHNQTRIIQNVLFFKKIFFNSKIITRKIVIKLGIPKDVKIIVSQFRAVESIKGVLEDRDFIVLDFQLDQIKEIYFSLRLFLLMISNISRFKLSKNYFISMLKLVNPKIFYQQVLVIIQFFTS